MEARNGFRHRRRGKQLTINETVMIMKRIFTAVLALAVLAGCTKNEGKPALSGDPVPVTLNASLVVETKAPVDEGDRFTTAIAAWESDADVDYAAAANWYNTAEVSASSAGAPVVLDPARTYNPDNAVKTHILAWSPASDSAPDGGKVTIDNPVGEVDAMVAAEVVGSARDYQNKVLAFIHPTTQLVFKVVADATLDAGTTIKSITIKNARIPDGFSLAEGGAVVTYAGAADLAVPGIAGEVIPSGGLIVGRPVMIEPFSGNEMKLDVVTSGAEFNDVVVTIDEDADFQPGKAYEITLTFRQTGVVLKASVAPWDYSGSGAAVIE